MCVRLYKCTWRKQIKKFHQNLIGGRVEEVKVAGKYFRHCAKQVKVGEEKNRWRSHRGNTGRSLVYVLLRKPPWISMLEHKLNVLCLKPANIISARSISQSAIV